MKYSLRSLIVVVTLVAVLLGGRIEYLRRWAVFHERRAADHEGDEITLVHSYHVSRAGAYRIAMWRPWTITDEPAPESWGETPDNKTMLNPRASGWKPPKPSPMKYSLRSLP
jgi:hypothetical protein